MSSEEPSDIAAEAAPISLIVNHEPGEDTRSPTKSSPKSTSSKKQRRKKKKFRRKKLHCFFLYFIGLTLFMAFGGLIFWIVEEKESQNYRANFEDQCFERKNELVKEFEDEIRSLLINAQSIDSRDMVEIFNKSINEFERCMRDKIPAFAIPHVFDFLGSTMYAVTIFTTVGYGDLITRTVYGRILTIIYGYFGIPFYIAFISDFGDFLGKQLISLGKYCRNSTWPIFNRSELTAAEKKKPLSAKFRFFFITSVLVIFLISLTFLIQQCEKIYKKQWTFMDSLHFVFSTVSLIGFGDIIASHDLYIGLYLPLFIIGQALCALSFYFIQRFIRYSIPQFITSICLKIFQPCDESPETENPSTIFEPRTDESSAFHERLIPCIPDESEDHSDTISVFAQRISTVHSPITKSPDLNSSNV